MEGRPSPLQLWVLAKRPLLLGLSLILLFSLAACKHGEQQTNTQALDEAGTRSNRVNEPRTLNVSNAQIGELTKARQRRPSASTRVELLTPAPHHSQPFTIRPSSSDF